VLVALESSNRVALFTLQGERLQSLTVKLPRDIAIWPNGDIIVANRDQHCITVFSSSGDLKRELSSADCPGIGQYPCALAVHEGRLYVMDHFSDTISVVV
jgi:hypothetical protein